MHVKGEESQKIRAIMSSRRSLLDKRLDLENHIRATLRTFGLKVGAVGLAAFAPGVRELIASDGDLQACVEPLLETRQKLHAQFRILTNMVMRFVGKDETCRRFMTVPGVGPLTALAFKTAIDDPARFQKSPPGRRAFWSHAAEALRPAKWTTTDGSPDVVTASRVNICSRPRIA